MRNQPRHLFLGKKIGPLPAQHTPANNQQRAKSSATAFSKNSSNTKQRKDKPTQNGGQTRSRPSCPSTDQRRAPPCRSGRTHPPPAASAPAPPPARLPRRSLRIAPSVPCERGRVRLLFTESNGTEATRGGGSGKGCDTDGSRLGHRKEEAAGPLRRPLVEEGDGARAPRAQARGGWARGNGCRSQSRAGGVSVRHGERRARGHETGTALGCCWLGGGGEAASLGGRYVGTRWPGPGCSYAAVATRWAPSLGRRRVRLCRRLSCSSWLAFVPHKVWPTRQPHQRSAASLELARRHALTQDPTNVADGAIARSQRPRIRRRSRRL